MSEREFVAWLSYAGKQMLPARRAELQRAMLCLTVAASAGNDKVSLQDFLFDEKPDNKLTAEEGARALDAIGSGGGVRRLGQGRKKK